MPNRRRGSNSPVWLADGTFKSAPALFYQLWVVHGRVQNAVTVPLIYALLPAKTAAIYKRALALILQEIDLVNPGARPKTIVIDFEMAEVLAFRELMGPAVKIHGCYYHYKQALWRKVQDLGLAARYKDEHEEGFRQHVKMFCALTFCDPTHIKYLFDQLAEVFVDLYDQDMGWQTTFGTTLFVGDVEQQKRHLGG